MKRGRPAANKLVARRQVQRSQHFHQKRLRKVRCTIDTSAPESMGYQHVRFNYKRAMSEAGA